ncbi:porin family protein [bacterium]|nr:MAG: porin family protein [bacterium]
MKRSLFFALLLAATITSAQDRWTLELRGGTSSATTDFGSANLKTGLGIEGTVAYRFMPNLSAYAGWGWNHFGADPTPAEEKLDFEETGYTVGLQFVHPIGESTLSYRLGAGAVFNHVEVENSAGDKVADTGHGAGWQLEAGLEIPLSTSMVLVPDVRYRSLPREMTTGSTTTAADLNYISVGVGFVWSL